jgi:hypothetical protein
MGRKFSPTHECLSALIGLQQKIFSFTLIILVENSAPQSEMYMKWILIVQTLLNKFTSEIQNTNSITIQVNENLLKCCCFTTGKQISSHRNTKVIQLAVSGKKQVVKCFNLSCSAFVLPSVGKTN